MRDDDIFKKLKKETPLVKRRDLQPLSGKDFAPKRSAFDMQMERSGGKRAARKTAVGEDGQGRPSLYGEDAQRPQPRTIQARSETRVRMSPEPLQRPQARTVSARSSAPQPEKAKPRAEAPQRHETLPRVPISKTVPEVKRAEAPQHPEIPTQAPAMKFREEAARRIAAPKPAAPQKSAGLALPREYGERTRRIREIYSGADASQLEVFSDTAHRRTATVRGDAPVLAPMVHRRTEFEEYFEPAHEKDAAPTFRHELKFYINYHEYVLLRNTLKVLAQLDKYAGENGEYTIRSLYFDDEYESALREKLGGSDIRRKYRVRIYNFKDDVIKFEKKIKQNQFVTKRTVNLSRDEYERILAGDYGFLLRRNEVLAPELFMELTTNRLRPRVIVDYVREAYVYPLENIRITFDKDLRSGMWRPGFTDIFDARIPTMPMYDEGMMVLEVKFEKYLPGPIRGVLGNITTAQRSAISKYVICRKFE